VGRCDVVPSCGFWGDNGGVKRKEKGSVAGINVVDNLWELVCR
jgi:hypothetical protein